MTPGPLRAIDYSALVDPVARADVAALRRERHGSSGWQTVDRGNAFAFALLACLELTLVIVVVVKLVTYESYSPVSDVVIPALLLVGVSLALALVGHRAFRFGDWRKWVRLTRFARANGLAFSPRDADPRYPGWLFGRGAAREVTDRLTSTSGRTIDIGTYSYSEISGARARTHRWGYLAMRLDRNLPNMVLARTGTQLFHTLALTRDQVLPLEGDFDSYFTLYCPKQYERDALYVFTPDLMALLVDEAALFDIEIVDSWLFVYSSRQLTPANPDLYRRLFGIVDTVGAKTLRQTERYADDRVGLGSAEAVARQGRRLRRRATIGGIAAVVGFSLVWIVPHLASLLLR